MISFDLLLAFILALVVWGLVHVARAIRDLAAALRALALSDTDTDVYTPKES